MEIIITDKLKILVDAVNRTEAERNKASQMHANLLVQKANNENIAAYEINTAHAAFLKHQGDYEGVLYKLFFHLKLDVCVLHDAFDS